MACDWRFAHLVRTTAIDQVRWVDKGDQDVDREIAIRGVCAMMR